MLTHVEDIPGTKILDKSALADQSPDIRTYAAGKYWDNRYAAQEVTFDWFFNYGALRVLLLEHLLEWKLLPCLHIGCGNSNLQEGLVSDGFVNVWNVDISPIVIEQMKKQHQGIDSLHYQVCDCRSMTEFEDSFFAAVIDKGTMDAVLCAKHSQQETFRYLREVDRVLRPGGIFLLISLGSPLGRLDVLTKAGLNWDIQVYLMPKPSMFLKSASHVPSCPGCPEKSLVSLTDKDDPITPMGPFLYSTYDVSNVVPVAEQHMLQPQQTEEQHLRSLVMNKEKGAAAIHAASAMMHGLEHKDHFYLYVCKKHTPES
ncbi:hypothetical protein CEUSTIGMA_g218.t1 [Chlamydomonas eustigma]|uniref:Methyltransferase type 11 domain-containing protein n=1 Tax=Chlamydomonas eustigma TaxID=1157962 RepID=A0A250WQ26_9CHLO|nr:hypothetical protein CEUSTIGMA_g218.t1 [Chlamydomonas eustigma]|eukprot:GAX72762.1 hypothetical protein CEUSTIGMA_g218.t1 [Chlamydomonas eustigma]